LTLSTRASRPDPDLLPAKVQRQEAQSRRGKLRIYFGSSAGVGKTYAMPVAARKLKDDGRDVVVGVAETHGRPETAAQLEGLEVQQVYQSRIKHGVRNGLPDAHLGNAAQGEPRAK
jgi:two-component system sensor histidine kinase KdpD